MATVNQLIRTPRVKKITQKKARLLEKSPQRKAVCTKVYITSPKKPNSAKRKVAKVRFSDGNRTIAYIPGVHILNTGFPVILRLAILGTAEALPCNTEHCLWEQKRTARCLPVPDPVAQYI